MFGRWWHLVIVFLICCAWPVQAEAHPHVWVNYYVTVIAGADGITKLRFRWRFDAMFSSLVRDEVGIKTITEKDSVKVKSHAFDNLKHYHFYMDIKADGKAFLPEDVTDFTVREEKSDIGKAEGGGSGTGLEYQFTVALPKAAKAVEFSLYDPEFYVDVEPPMQEVSAEKPGIMATATYKPKEFVSLDAEDGGVNPVCSGHDGKPRASVWGDFPVYVVECRAEP